MRKMRIAAGAVGLLTAAMVAFSSSAGAMETPPSVSTVALMDASDRLTRLEMRYAPSFSPWIELRWSWVQRGSWQVASVIAHWAPPWPAYTNSELRSARAWGELQALVSADEHPWREAPCEAFDHETLRPGAVLLKIDRESSATDWSRLCVEGGEDSATRRAPDLVDALMERGASVEGFDRWSHPFWLVRESGLLRFDLQGYGWISINDEALGAVQGTVSVRLPAGEHDVRVRAASGEETREFVRVAPDQTTILRLRLNGDDVQRAQEASNQ